MGGKFIVFEGPDGSGKTTQIKLLKEYLESKSFKVVTTREPGGTKISEAIRNILLDTNNGEMDFKTEALLYASARAQHVEELIKPSLESGGIVLCDRFVDSTIAYQGYGRNLDLEFLMKINQLATGGLKPELTFVIDIDPREGRKRIMINRKGQNDRIEQEKLDFHQRVRQGYLKLAQKDSERYKIIDGQLNVNDIRETIIKEVERIL